jgi:phosphoribosylanthranilate isomerase
MILKICGITNQEDAAAAVAAGATALGLNFYPRSPRRVSVETAAGILTPEGVLRVGVFVNERPETVAGIARAARLDVAQLHGDEPASQYPAAVRVWKAARVGDGFDVAAFENCPAEALLLDGPAAGLYGGAGHPFDWSLVAAARLRIILAGGLDASNIARAIRLVRPWGVDACSRLESSPGKKDHEKMFEFLSAARAALAA